MKTRANFTTERVGVNHVRSIVEGAGCFFKEANLLYDVGHDASLVLVVENEVLAKEVALQIKSGRSYVKGHVFQFPASAAHISYWADHDLQTIGVVYDTDQQVAYWVDLTAESKALKRERPGSNSTITFDRLAWNRFDQDHFERVLVPTLCGQAPRVSLETACEWLESEEMSTYDLGLRTLRARHRKCSATWRAIIRAFQTRPVDSMTADTPISIAALLGHDDLGFYDIPPEVRAEATALVLAFGPDEIAKALALVDDSDFDRPSVGYSMMPLLGMSVRSPQILAEIGGENRYGEVVRERSLALLEWYHRESDWWRLWLRDRRNIVGCSDT